MSRNIPVNDHTYNTFTSLKKAMIELNETDNKITNDTFIEILINDFSQKKMLNEYLSKNILLKKEIKNNGKGMK